MPRFLLFFIFCILLFRCVIAETPGEEKRATPFHPQKNASHNPDGCKKQGKQKEPQFVQGEVLVKFRVGVTRKGIDGIREAYGLLLIKRLESIGVYRFKIPSGSTVGDMVDALNKNPQVEYAEPNYTMSITGN